MFVCHGDSVGEDFLLNGVLPPCCRHVLLIREHLFFLFLVSGNCNSHIKAVYSVKTVNSFLIRFTENIKMFLLLSLIVTRGKNLA